MKVDSVGKKEIINPKSERTTVEEEKEKALSREGRKNLLFTMAGIRLASDSDSEQERNTLEKTLKEKQQFMADDRNGIKQSTGLHLVTQSRRFPLMGKAIAALKESYEQWDQHLTDEGLEGLQNKMRTQQQNVQALSEILNSLTSQSEGADRALSQFLPYGQEDTLLETLLDAYASGHIKMTSEGKAKLKQTLLARVETIQSEQEPVSLKKDKEEHQKNFPTKEAIKKQAELHQRTREGKQSAATQNLDPQDKESANIVTKLNELGSDETIAFYKVGSGGEQAAGVMETLMWDLAVIMGAEEQFVATGETTVRSKHELRDLPPNQKLEEGEEKILHWDKGELKPMAAKKVRRGGIQPAQKGTLLHEYMNLPKNKRHIDKDDLNKATVASLAFGMFDAHANNIFVTEEGKIKFFDNTRSLPHSNGCVNWNGIFLLSSYRSGLLALKESHHPLDDKEKEQLKTLLDGYEEKFEQLKQYLEPGEKDVQRGKKQVQKLPPGWLNSQKALQAMKERITLMKTALERNEVNCLRDLATCSNPDFRFSFVLKLAADFREYVSSRFEKGKLNLTRCMARFSNEYIDHTDCINTCTAEGIDLSEIRKWCDDDDLSFEQILEKLGEYLCDLRDDDSPLDDEERREIEASNASILQDLFEKAELDLKDINREKATELTIDQVEKALQDSGHTIYTYDEECLNQLQKHRGAIQIITESRETYPPTYVLLSKKETGEIANVELDLYSRTGFVKFNSRDGKIQEMPFEEFLRKLDSPWNVDDVSSPSPPPPLSKRSPGNDIPSPPSVDAPTPPSDESPDYSSIEP